VTRGGIKTLIQAAGHGTDTDAAQNAAIEASLNELAQLKDWSWLEAQSASATIAVGDRSVNALPTDISTVTDVRIEFGTDYIEELFFMESGELLERSHLDRDNGVPMYWTWYNNELLIHPRPDKVYVVTLDYKMTPTPPPDDGWVPPFDAQHHMVLAWGALRWLSFRQRDWNAYNAASSEYRLAIRAMMSDDESAKPARNVPHWRGWGLVKRAGS
jgi:hypothetical protein